MSRKPKTIPYGEIERDLCSIARARVSDAVNSALQLADTKETKFLITIQAMAQAVAMCAGAYSSVYVGRQEDPFEVAKIVLQLAQEAKL